MGNLSLTTWIILGCTILLTVVLSTSMYYMYTHIEELTQSPLVYGAKKTSEINGGAPVMCSCMVDVPTTNAFGRETRDPWLYFNTTSIWNEEHERQSIAQNFNLSNLQRIFNVSNESN